MIFAATPPETPGNTTRLESSTREIVNKLGDEDVQRILGRTKADIVNDMQHPEDVHRVSRSLLGHEDLIRTVQPEFDGEQTRRELFDVGSIEQRLSILLGIKEQEVQSQMDTLQGIKNLQEHLKGQESEIKELDPSFNSAELEEGLKLAIEVIEAKDVLAKDMKSPEKAGVMRRALDKLTSFPKKHPIVTTLLVAALAAGGMAGGLYLAGNWELFLTNVGLGKILGSAEGAGEMIPPTLYTPPHPGGGMLDMPPPSSSPTPQPGLGTIT